MMNSVNVLTLAVAVVVAAVCLPFAQLASMEKEKSHLRTKRIDFASNEMDSVVVNNNNGFERSGGASVINNNNNGGSGSGSFGPSTTFINNNNGFPNGHTIINNNSPNRFDTTFINNNGRPTVLTNSILASLPSGSLIITNDGQTIFVHKNTQLVIHVPNQSGPSGVAVPPPPPPPAPLTDSIPPSPPSLPTDQSSSSSSAVIANQKQEIKEHSVSVSENGETNHVASSSSRIKQTEQVQTQQSVV